MGGYKDIRALVERARSGDAAAFDELTAGCRDGALRYAQAILGDFHLAEDAVQEALAAAFLSLDRLRHPEDFPAWLRGILRFQCYRTLRLRHAVLLSLDSALHLTLPGADPQEHLEQIEQAEGVRKAVRGLPGSQRSVVELFYFGDLSQREVAAQLDMPVTTVNNRLHAARQKLKGGLQAMVRDDLGAQLTRESAQQGVGTVLAVDGSVIEARFDGPLPRLYSTLEFADKDGRGDTVAAVIQRPSQGRVRCVAALDRRSPSVGSAIRDLRRPMATPIRPAALGQALSVLAPGPLSARRPSLLETGIKAVDLLCPLAEGGNATLTGDVGAGKLVLTQEIVHNVQPGGKELSLFDFAQAGHGTNLAWSMEGQQPEAAGSLQTFYLPVDDPTDLASPALRAVADRLDALIYMAHERGLEGLWPAVDPERSSSRLLDTDAVTPEHRNLAEQVRSLLRRYRDLKRGTHPDDVAALLAEERTAWERATRMENFLTQPFFSAEPYTKVPGRRVPLSETLSGCKAILEGQCDDVPGDSLLFAGSIDDALTRSAG